METSEYTKEIRGLIKEIEINRGRDPMQVIPACDKLEGIGKSIDDDALIGFAYFSRGETYYCLNDTNNFYNQMISCLGPFERVKEWNYLALANNMLGIVSLNRGNAPFALDYYIKAISICQENALADIEWMVHMNLGSLYLNIEEYQKALNHIKNCRTYLNAHKSMPGYIENITTVYLGMARAYLKLDNINKVIEIVNQIKKECMPNLNDADKVVLYCFFARMHNYLDEDEARDYWIDLVSSRVNSNMPIMDVFDDFYEFLEMLLKAEKFDDFFKIYDVLDDMIKKTTIKNLERKLLALKIQYFKNSGHLEEYKLSAMLYFELSAFMERENRKMVSDMVVMRNSYVELTKINKKVEQENSFLHKKSETDPLTGMYNRFRLNEYSDELMKRAAKKKCPVAVEILDIDYFKQYNDNYGHQAGDKCIKFIAEILIEMSQEEGIFAARYGGDEFVLIYEGYDKEQVIERVEKLSERVKNGNFEHLFSLVDNVVTITQGICFAKKVSDHSIFKLLNQADTMLYEVKQKSRNNYKISDYSI